MTTEIETYLNSLSEDIITLSIHDRGIKVLPDLTRFKNLKELYCCFNELSSLPTTLPQSLEVLDCSGNKLSSLPDLPQNLKQVYFTGNELSYLPTLPQTLERLYCSSNKLASLPTLPQNLKVLECCNNELSSLPTTLPQTLERLFCVNNKLTYLPTLPEKIVFVCWDNPIWDILDNDNNSFMKVKDKIKIINNFRHLNYSLQFKKKFIKWLWKSREKQIMEKYHPKYLLENLDDNADLDEFLNNW